MTVPALDSAFVRLTPTAEEAKELVVEVADS